MSSIIDVLPSEIIDEIIGIISNDDDQEDRYFKSPNVKACSLTCHTFSRLCRRHIFHSIKLYEVNARPPKPWIPRRPLAQSFANLITNSPEIAEYVRELHYIVQNRDSEDVYPVPPALSGLLRLKSLAIYADSSLGFQWRGAHGVHAGSRSILLSLMHLPTIVSIELGYIRGFTPSDLGPCSNLKFLCLWEVYFAEIDEGDLPITPIRLQRLETDGTRRIDIFGLKGVDRTPIFDLGSLKRIRLDIIHERYDASAVSDFLARAKNLEEIHIFFSFAVNPIDFLSKASLKSAKILSLDMDIRPLDELHDLLVILKHMKTDIESLKIRLQNGPDEYSPPLHESVNWDSFKEDIVNIAWPSLTRFEMGVYTGVQISEVGPSLEMEMVKGVSSSTSPLMVFRYYNLKGSIPCINWRANPS